ncbi:MAG: mechanosensitive ion channel family protein [Clostridia bacterium]|jgi:small conductance mechanosensitive channel|nr:mechanosensitive ion channel family protein [Clostridia bacterium]
MKKNNLKQQTEEMKAKVKRLGPVKIIILLIMLVGTICSYVFHDYIFASDSIFNRGISTSEFLNSLLALVPNIVRAIQVITIILVATSIIIGIINRLFTKTQREITVVKLTSSIIKWVAAIILVIAVLAIWGVDTTALITGAGVLTLIVGLGMQSLISDIVAGLFIVFENEFNVGDIITVDGFRGTVVSIGIRTTQLEAVGNVKIFNNSEIRGVLNQTVKPSKAKTLIDIEYGDSLARVEEIIKNKLPEIKIEGVIGEIVYDGVAALGASGVTLQFTADCDENDIFAVQRAMNGRLKVMFDENGIGIPFNQLVVHMDKK